MVAYIKCPRCDLNYISEEQEYCDVCKAELKKGPKLLFANDDDEEIDTTIPDASFLDDFDDSEDEE